MDLTKSYEFFKPEMCPEKIHIIGCGAVGSTVAENLVRFGLTNIVLYDFDTVEPHNIANQMFRQVDIGKKKVEALADMLVEINPDIKGSIKLVDEGWNGQRLSGYVFLCVDNIELRKRISETCKSNTFIKAVFDFRMGLTEGQHFAADWSNHKMIENFIGTMSFTHEEAKAATPVSACNIPMSVAPTVRMLVAAGVSNFVNFVKTKQIKKMILVDAFEYGLTAI